MSRANRHRCRPWIAVALLLAVGAGVGRAQDAAAPARCIEAEGALLARAPGTKDWRAVKAGDALAAGDEVVSLFDAWLRSGNGAVETRLLADVGQRGPLPVLESAARIQHAKGYDLTLDVERGLIGLKNVQKEGPAKVQLRVRGTPLDVTLKKPGTILAVELYGRHPPGPPQLDDPKKDDPVLYAVCVVLKGEVYLRGGGKGVQLHAPPGPAMLIWDSIFREPEIRTLDELPDTCKPLTDKEKKALAALNVVARPFAGKDRGAALDAALKSDNPLARKAAVTALGALDDLPRLLKALSQSPHADVRDHAVLVLRSWLGRAPGQTHKLYGVLTSKGGFTPVQARNALHLLFGYGPDEMRRPEAYQVLIELLDHKRPGVRELAHWHLVRAAAAGRDIPYDALAPEADRRRAQARWQQLIPPGRLPPEPKKTKSK